MKSSVRKMLFSGTVFALCATAHANETAAGTTAEASAILPAYSFAALVKNSPFKAKAKNRPVGNIPAAARHLRFVGMFTIDGKTAFGLYDNAVQRSFWLNIREENDAGIFVERFDAERKTLAIRIGAERVSLPLATPEEKPLPIRGSAYIPAQHPTTPPKTAVTRMQPATRIAPTQPAAQQRPQRDNRPR